MTDNQFDNVDIKLDSPLCEDGMLAPPKNKKRQLVVGLVSVFLVVVLAIVCALLVKTYVISSFVVHNVSMYPTLDGGNGASNDDVRDNGEILYLNKLASIKRGDIVVFSPKWAECKYFDEESQSYQYSSLVKRVIAVEGDTVSIVDGKLYLNGSILKEDYILEPMNNDYNNRSWTIEEGYIFCVGDNRNHSADCREYGPVEESCVVGKCFLIKGIDGKLRSV